MSDGPPPPVPGSRIEVVERDERLVLRIPAGGPRARSIFWFALFWNALSWAVAGTFWGVAVANGVDWNLKPAGGQDGPVPWFVLPLVGLFPAIGVGLVIWWSKLRFTHTLLFAAPATGGEPATVAVRTEWFGRERTRTIRLEPGDRAELEVAYEENDRPRYRVRVGPQEEKDRTLAFGTAWADDEVRWVAESINQTLGVEAERFPDDAPGAPPRTAPVAADANADHPHVRTGLDARGRSIVEARCWPGWPPGKRTLAAFMTVSALAWWAALIFIAVRALPDAGQAGGRDLVGFLFLVPFALVGMMIISVPVAVCRASVRTTIAEEGLILRWGVGLLRYTYRVPRERISAVVVWENFGTVRDARGSRPVTVAAVRVDPPVKLGSHVPLSLGGGREVAEDVAGLVRHRLESTGWRPVPDGL
ncbi:hypothetical protein [Alienimonas californiensis]|uniref:Uncharacterized protein n=1 Tax=Alienimonas californiensis TaxID=2527989 RepID=A0A517PBZ6_9PLAN|nr:hypothetical protein [Alienimonas californiensis]QDT16882.1 hypothetical protein CA12_29900 [Alienimonas californiensis]